VHAEALEGRLPQEARQRQEHVQLGAVARPQNQPVESDKQEGSGLALVHQGSPRA
jgi:hypothetical protein